jgi:two-component system sensor histidine kinase RegB
MKEIVFDANRKNLLQLLKLRTIAIIGQIFTILFTHYTLGFALPLSEMFAVLGLISVVSLVRFFQKKVTDRTIFIELIFDIIALTAQLYFSGGASNPFVSLFLLQVIIGAILLEKFYPWLIALITVACYVWLGFYNQGLEQHHHHHGDSFGLHLQGMLISYILAAILLLVFITQMSRNLRERDQMMRLAMLATSAAHELGTPLSTISVVIGDWKKIVHDQGLKKDIDLIDSQLVRCKKIISSILSESGNKRVEDAKEL